MVSNRQVRSNSLYKYAIEINNLRIANRKKALSIEKVAKKLIEENGNELKKKFIQL